MTKETLYILHGSRTGNSRAAAELAGKYADHLDIGIKLVSMEEFDPEDFASARNVLIAVSTHGDGDPPLQAEPFYNFLKQNEATDFSGKRYSVLALGDSSYKHFCKTVKDIDAWLSAGGAESVYPLVECDIDFEDRAKSWVKQAVDTFAGKYKLNGQPKNEGQFIFELNLQDGEGDYFRSTVLEKRLLTGEKSSKQIFNLTLDLENSGFEYHSGDSFGIICPNSKLFVDQLIRQLGFDPTVSVRIKDRPMLLKQAGCT